MNAHKALATLVIFIGASTSAVGQANFSENKKKFLDNCLKSSGAPQNSVLMPKICQCGADVVFERHFDEMIMTGVNPNTPQAQDFIAKVKLISLECMKKVTAEQAKK